EYDAAQAIQGDGQATAWTAPVATGTKTIRHTFAYDDDGNLKSTEDDGCVDCANETRITSQTYPLSDRCGADWVCASTGGNVFETDALGTTRFLREQTLVLDGTGDVVEVRASLQYPQGVGEPPFERDATYGTNALPPDASSAIGTRTLLRITRDVFGNATRT